MELGRHARKVRDCRSSTVVRLSAARYSSDVRLRRGQLEGCRMPEGRREIFEKIYSATREQLRRLLFTTGTNHEEKREREILLSLISCALCRL